jgi:hypothetical protein
MIYLNYMASKIQGMYRNSKLNHLMGITRRAMKARSTVGFSSAGDNILISLLSDPDCKYSPPGVRHNTPQFSRAANQHTMYCNNQFSPTDCVLLSAVLRHTLCRIRRLVFHCVNALSPNFEYELIPAIRVCRSLRSVLILGGRWSVDFIAKLFREVQCECPMVKEIHVENVSGHDKTRMYQLLDGCVNLLMDFFNYSLPGIQSITLHGLGLLNDDAELLAKGIAVNTSLSSLHLSFNMIESPGFIAVFSAATKNKKSNLSVLDFGYNLVTLELEIVHMFDAFCGPALPDRCLRVNLIHNRIASHYKPLREFRQDLFVTTIQQEEVSPVTGLRTQFNSKPGVHHSPSKQSSAFRQSLLKKVKGGALMSKTS